jgi:glycosyltransferase involved in cell wall biosynthesis
MLRVMMTLDAVGGVWPYALDTAAMLTAQGMACRLLGLGPPPARPVALPPGVDVVWTDEPLDWMVTDEAALDTVAPAIAAWARDWRADVVHLSAPSQAVGQPDGPAVIVQSHSCVPTWWAAMRGNDLPAEWRWQVERNRAGFHRADGVIVPSASHGHALKRVYGVVPRLRVVPNATTSVTNFSVDKQAYVFAAGRWWDEGKNGQVLDAAAARTSWPILMAGALAGPNGTRLNLENAIALGQLPGAEVRVHMARAAIFAAPSRYEPFGLAVLEAASVGACLLLADIATFRELWDGAAIFVDPIDPSAWSHTIAALADDPPRRAALGEQARLKAAAFTFDSQRVALLAAYDAAVRVQSMPIAEFV